MKQSRENISALIQPLGIPLMGEGCMMLFCLLPDLLAMHRSGLHLDGMVSAVLASGLFTLAVGLLVRISFSKESRLSGRKSPYLLVTLIWVVLALFGSLPFLASGALRSFSDAFFESMSGLTSTGATVFSDVEHLPPSILLWRSMSQWIGGFGIILLVLAVVPSLGINKYSLYTAEASGADNTGKVTTSLSLTVRRTLSVYLALTLVFVLLLVCSGMSIWAAVNLTFTNISSGGFSIYSDSIASLTSAQQYILAGAMFFSGVNFMLIFHFFNLQFSKVRHKLDQFSFYLLLILLSSAFVAYALYDRMGMSAPDAVRNALVQTLSVITTTGSLVGDTSTWWMPVTFLFVTLSLCGGMAGSTTGGLKAMRVLILLRNVRNKLRIRLHPHAVDPVRLNGKPVSNHMIQNVMVIFFVYLFVILIGIFALMLSGEGATESVGAAVACITSYGPGLGPSGGFGSYADFSIVGKWVLSLLMLMGRLECLTVLVLLTGRRR